MTRRFLPGLLLCLFAAAVWAGPTWQLTILHTNDMHGELLPLDYSPHEGYTLHHVGGLARCATAIAQIRQSLDHPCVVLDCGDFFVPKSRAVEAEGLAALEALNQLGCELLCVGNNEFKGAEGTSAQDLMLRLVRRSRFPWLAANLTVGDTGLPPPGIQPFVVRQYGGVRVGFLGLTAPRAADYEQTEGWTISDPLAAARYWVPLVRHECDLLIVVTHLGSETDGLLAATVPGIDAIIGGDSHTYLRGTTLVTAPDGRRVPISQAGEFGVMLGRLDLTFEHNGDWRLTHALGRLYLMDDRYAPDPAMAALLAKWRE